MLSIVCFIVKVDVLWSGARLSGRSLSKKLKACEISFQDEGALIFMSGLFEITNNKGKGQVLVTSTSEMDVEGTSP